MVRQLQANTGYEFIRIIGTSKLGCRELTSPVEGIEAKSLPKGYSPAVLRFPHRLAVWDPPRRLCQEAGSELQKRHRDTVGEVLP